jgi:hypothetical protein
MHVPQSHDRHVTSDKKDEEKEGEEVRRTEKETG